MDSSKDESQAARFLILALISSTEEKDIVESYKLGVNSYILKPVDFDKFVDAAKGIGYYWLLLNQSPKR